MHEGTGTGEEGEGEDIPNDFPMVASPGAADEPSEKFGVPSNGMIVGGVNFVRR
jgi:hypothetical protein